jgi:peroxiredoxin Q/BCP
MQAFQNDLARFEKLNAQVLGVSPDSVATHIEFAKKYGLKFPLLADEQGQMQKLYASGRVTFLIDKDGVVRFVQKGVPNNKEFLKELAKL